MKSKLFLSIAAVFVLASCACDKSDESSMTGRGSGKGHSKTVQAPVQKKQAPVKLTLDRVFFGYDKYDLTDEGRKTLSEQADWIKANPGTAVVIEGNCDERGTREYNIGLGARRANAVRGYLISQGVNPSQMTITSYGKDRPSVAGSNPEAWAQNRNAITRPQ